MKNLAITLLLLIGFNALGSSTSIADSAASYYRQGKYERSAQSLELLLQQNYVSSDLYAALGNSYYKQNNIGLAILNYERALKLNPGNADLQDNLNLANAKKSDKISEDVQLSMYTSIKKLNASIRYDTLAWIALSLMAIAAVGIIVSRFAAKDKRKRLVVSGLLLNGLGLLMLCFALYQKSILDKNIEGIVLDPSIEVHSEPSSTSGVVVTLHEGSKIILDESDRNWIKVRINAEYSGWILKSSVAEI